MVDDHNWFCVTVVAAFFVERIKVLVTPAFLRHVQVDGRVWIGSDGRIYVGCRFFGDTDFRLTLALAESLLLRRRQLVHGLHYERWLSLGALTIATLLDLLYLDLRHVFSASHLTAALHSEGRHIVRNGHVKFEAIA